MQVSGVVERGRGEAGPVYGLPTANIRVPGWFRPGVYAGKVTTDQGTFDAIVCFGAYKDILEAHLFQFKGHLVGQTITIEILDKVSDIDPLISVEQMREKIEDDVKKVRVCLQE